MQSLSALPKYSFPQSSPVLLHSSIMDRRKNHWWYRGYREICAIWSSRLMPSNIFLMSLSKSHQWALLPPAHDYTMTFLHGTFWQHSLSSLALGGDIFRTDKIACCAYLLSIKSLLQWVLKQWVCKLTISILQEKKNTEHIKWMQILSSGWMGVQLKNSNIYCQDWQLSDGKARRME